MDEVKEINPVDVVRHLRSISEKIGDDSPYVTSKPEYRGLTKDQMAKKALEKYGINDVEAGNLLWADSKINDITATSKDIELAVDTRNKIFEKILTSGSKVKDYSPLIPKGSGVTTVQRVIGSYIPEKDLKRYLEKAGYDVQHDLNTNRVLVKRPNEVQYSEFNPNKIDVMDFIDKAPDVIEGALTLPLSKFGGPWGVAIASGIGALSEATRQGVSMAVKGRDVGDVDYLDIGKSAAISGGMGAGAELVGSVARRVGPALKEIAATKALTRAEKPLLMDAAKKLGFEFTEEELSRSPAKRKLFDAIQKADESLVGYFTGEYAHRKAVQGLGGRVDKLEDITSGILNEASLNSVGLTSEQLGKSNIGLIKYNMGKEVKDTVASSIKTKQKAASELYDSVRNTLKLKDFKADLTVLNKEIKSLKNSFKGNSEAVGIIDNITAQAKELTSLNEVNNLRSMLLSKASVASRSGDDVTHKVYNDLASGLKNVEDDTYLKLIDKFSKGAEKEFIGTAEKATKYANKDPSALFPKNKNIKRLEQAEKMKQDLATARTLWRDANEEATKFYKETGETWSAGLGSKIKEIETGKSEDMLGKIVAKGDVEKQRLMSETYPELWAKAAKADKAEDVYDIIDSLSLGQVRNRADWSKTIQQLSKLGSEDLSILLGKDALEKLEALKVVYKYAPEVINASGTRINEGIIKGGFLQNNKEAFGRWLNKVAYDATGSGKVANILDKYAKGYKGKSGSTITKAVGQTIISSEKGGE